MVLGAFCLLVDVAARFSRSWSAYSYRTLCGRGMVGESRINTSVSVGFLK